MIIIIALYSLCLADEVTNTTRNRYLGVRGSVYPLCFLINAHHVMNLTCTVIQSCSVEPVNEHAEKFEGRTVNEQISQ